MAKKVTYYKSETEGTLHDTPQEADLMDLTALFECSPDSRMELVADLIHYRKAIIQLLQAYKEPMS